MNHKAFVGLGSNIGDREQYLEQAVRRIDAHPSIRVTDCSSVYETDPVGYTDQPLFLNMVVALRTALDAHALFDHLVQVENALGRTRELRWGPRTIDLDLLLYDRETSSTVQLELPHPRMFDRLFVLEPLSQIAPAELRDRIEVQLEQLRGKEGIHLWRTTDWPNAFGHSVN